MPSRLEIVQRIEHNCEALEPLDIELGIFDVCVMRLDFDIGVEFASGIFCNLL